MIRLSASRIAVVGVALLALAASFAACPRAAAAPNPANRFFGKVTAVDLTANTISLHNKKKGDATFSVTSDTKVHVNRQKASLSDVHVGMMAVVRSLDGKTAKAIFARDAKPGQAPNGTSSPATSPTTPAQ